MAHIAKLGALTDELVTLLTSTSTKCDCARFNVYRETALRNLRTVYPRTNQFDIASQLEGLEEKFRVYNEDPLADALKERLLFLKGMETSETKWEPEILQLLLELSDKPVSKSKLEDLDFLKEPEPSTKPPLKWEDLIAEDPLLRDEKIWGNVDFGPDSSEEDWFEDSRSEVSAVTEETVQSNPDGEYGRSPGEYTVDTLDTDGLGKLRDAQFWKKTPNVNGVVLETVKKPITELQAIREVLFMFSGFLTSLFEVDLRRPDLILPSQAYALKHVPHEAFMKLLQDIANQGSSIMALRLWSKRKQPIPLLQILQNCIGERLSNFGKELSQVEQRYVGQVGDIPVSLQSVQVELGSSLESLVPLSEVIKKLDTEPYAHAFRYLEILYDQTCIAQMAGDDEIYTFLGTIFFECFQVYLRPLRAWMQDGELRNDDKIFFVSEAAGEVEPASLWESRFKLRTTQNGVLHAPNFLQTSASKIFITGKSVVVLKHLNRFATPHASRSSLEPVLDFNTVCNPSQLNLAPFSDLFDVAFAAWIRSKHHHTSSMLRKTLFNSCGLHTSLEALSHLYFLADGINGAKFTNSIFDKLDTLDTSWADRFTITELAQSTLGSLSNVAPERLRISVTSFPRKYQEIATCRRTVKALAAIELKYQLSWPIQTILTPATMSSYQRIFTFLFQIRRSSHILSRRRLINDPNSTTNSEYVLYYSLRTRLLWFTQTLYYYITALVIEPNYSTMRMNLKDADDVDSMIQVHKSYIKTTLDKALLGKKLELIHHTILNILDQGIKLEDLQAANEAATKKAEDEQREMMDLSIASLGLHTPRKSSKPSKIAQSTRQRDKDSDDEELDVDLSILSSNYEDGDNSYEEKLQKMKAEFDRLVRFVATGLRGVARAGTGGEGRSWDMLGGMLEGGLGVGNVS